MLLASRPEMSSWSNRAACRRRPPGSCSGRCARTAISATSSSAFEPGEERLKLLARHLERGVEADPVDHVAVSLDQAGGHLFRLGNDGEGVHELVVDQLA